MVNQNYLSSMSQVVLALGGSGHVGIGAVHHLLESNNHVIVPTRNTETKEKLEKRFSSHADHLHVIVLDGYNQENYKRIQTYITTTFGKDGLDHVISSSGGFCDTKGRLLSSTTTEEFTKLFNERVMPHHESTQFFYPMLKESKNPSPSFLFITGLSGTYVFSSFSTLLTIANAAIYGIVLSLQFEVKQNQDKVRVNELRIGTFVRDQENEPDTIMNIPGVTSKYCGEALVSIIHSTAGGKIFTTKAKQDYQDIINEHKK